MSELYRAAIVSGIAVGGTYALVAVGITQVFAVTRVLNFAHAGFTMWAAYLYSMFTIEKEWSVGTSAVATIVCVGLMGLAAEVVVFRLASRATAVNKIILTFGLMLFLTALATKVWSYEPKAAVPLMPNGGFDVLNTSVSWQQLCNLVAVALVIVGVGGFLRFTKLGLQTRAMAEDSTIAELMGTSRSRVGMFNWTLAASIAGVAGVLAASLQPFQSGQFLQYFLIALIATLVGGLRSLTLTALGGLGLGVILSVSQIASSEVGTGSLAVFVAVVALVLLRRRWPSELGKIAWSKPQLTGGNRLWLVNRVVLVLGWAWLLLAIHRSDFWGQTGAVILVYTVAALSLVPLTGWTGQISLAQGGFMAIGAFTLGEAYVYHQLPMGAAVALVLIAGAVAGTVVGLISYRLSFVQTAIVTLAFTGAVTQWLLYTGWFHTSGGRLSVLAPEYLGTGRRLFVGFAVVTAVVILLLRNLRRSQWGIAFLGVRTAPDMARHFGLRPAVVRVGAFAVSGAVAAVAGGLYILLVSIADPFSFGIALSLSVLLYAVAGGTGSLVGPLIGSLMFIGAPQALNLSQYGSTNIPDIIGGLAIVQLMATRPDGLLSMLRRPARAVPSMVDRAVDAVTGRLPGRAARRDADPVQTEEPSTVVAVGAPEHV